MPKPIKNLTVSLTDEKMIEDMEALQDVNWSAVAKKAIRRYIELRKHRTSQEYLSNWNKKRGRSMSKVV